MANITADVPSIDAPLVDMASGQITLPWFMLLQQLYRRTGAGTGDNGDVTAAVDTAFAQAADFGPDPALLSYIDNQMIEMFMQSPMLAMQIECKVSEMVNAAASRADNLCPMIFAPGEDTP